jgi:hypothetical protein
VLTASGVNSGGNPSVAQFNSLAGNVTSDTAHASDGGEASITNVGTSAVSHDTLTADGTNSNAAISNGGGVSTEPVSNDTVTATNGGLATIRNLGDSTVALTHDTAIGNNGWVIVVDAGSSSATALNTGPANFTSINGGSFNGVTAGASVSYATDSTATAENAGSQAAVSGNPTITDGYITDSHATDIYGPSTSTIVEASDTTSANGMVVPHVEMTPLADVHEMHMMPAMPLP